MKFIIDRRSNPETSMKKFTFLFAALITTSSVHAAIIQFDLIGTAGSGLRSGSEPTLPFATNASGGEIGVGILFDDGGTPGDGGLLTVSNVGWGSSQGFNNLSTTASASHIHGPTAGNNGGGGFTQVANVLFTLTRSSSAATGGTFTNTPIALTGAQETDLFNGKYYMNIHTGNNSNGEIRGFLVQVPEPSTALLAAAGLIGLLGQRRRKG